MSATSNYQPADAANDLAEAEMDVFDIDFGNSEPENQLRDLNYVLRGREIDAGDINYYLREHQVLPQGGST